MVGERLMSVTAISALSERQDENFKKTLAGAGKRGDII